MLFAMLLFSVMQVWVKQLSYIPFFELIFFRSIVSLIICIGTIKYKKLNFWGNNKPMLVGRAIFGMASLSCFFYALQNMPLGSLITIVNIKPFLVLLWVTLFLKEKVSIYQWICFGVCFAGILWLKGIDGRIETMTLLAAIGAALFASIAHTFVKKLGQTEESNVILFYFTLVCVPVFGPLTFTNWVEPKSFDWLLCLGIGLITHFAQLLLTKSYQVGKVAIVSNLYYIGIVFAFGFGYFLFEEKYTFNQLLAVALVVLGIIGNILVSKKFVSKG